MYCQKCGTLNDDNAYKCVNCDALLHEASAPRQQIPNYLAQSILVTVLCCLPLGIPAIVYSAQVNNKFQMGDIEGAMTASRKAKFWAWWSFGSGLVVGLLYFMLALVGEVQV